MSSLPPGTHQVGPSNGTLQVRTYREGMAARAGHDLVIDVTRWQATVAVNEQDVSQSSVEFNADARSLQVRDGTGGVKPISDKDRADISKNIDEKVLHTNKHQDIRFRSTAVVGTNGRLTVSGDLTILGNSRPVTMAFDVSPDGTVKGATEIVQSQWGIKPYSGLMGALKVRDAVEITLEARLPG